MRYCTNCGAPSNDDKAKFCAACGFMFPVQMQNNNQVTETECKNHNNRNNKKKNILVFSSLAILIFSIIVICFTMFSHRSSDPTLSRCAELVGSPIEDILENDDYRLTSFYGITTAKTTTDDVFGVSGEIVIFILEDEEHVDIVTWQSKDSVRLTATEINTFVDSLISIYGKPLDSGEEDIYLWYNDDLSIMLKTESNEIYMIFANGK